jgi:hypothetical protein
MQYKQILLYTENPDVQYSLIFQNFQNKIQKIIRFSTKNHSDFQHCMFFLISSSDFEKD